MIFCREPTCSTDLLGICFNVLLCASFLLKFAYEVSSEKNWPRTIFRVSSLFQIISIALNSCFGLVCFSLGLWNLEERYRKGSKHSPLLWCLVLLTKGFTWFLIGLMLSIRATALGRIFIRAWSVIMTLFAGNLCMSSALDAVEERNISTKAVLDTLSFLGATLLLTCVFKHSEKEEDSNILHGSLYSPLNGESDTKDGPVASISSAGFFSRMSFWWLNPLLKEGYKKPLEEKDIPPLDEEDKAENCYSLFLEKLNKQNNSNHMGSPSILRAIVSCHQKEILVSGIFALLKVLSLSAGPMLLNAFINVSSGKEAFKFEGFLLALGLFAAKFLESLSQRQWYFRTKRIGMQLRSLLSAAIFHKQLRLPNSAKHVHSSGEIVNYLTVDSYRIGEFSFWFHQMWSMILQLCTAVMILYNSVGFAAIPAMVVIILAVASNTPLAKLQDKFQTKLMAAQDERMKATSEALTNMKVLKLYAWETHFRKVLEGLRKIEFKWLFASQLRKAYANFLLLSSPVLVSATTFFTCYILGVPLYAGNVFTFVATLRLVQEPIRQIPEVIGVVIQAKVSFNRIVNFLDTPELQNSHSREKHSPELGHPIVIKSASFCWDENSVEPILRNINLEVCTGEKVAVCGEIGSGKSTLLAAVLGEIPCSEGMIQVHGKLAYVSQNAWIQTGSIQENILFGSPMDKQRYGKILEKCCLVKDIEMLPFGDLTEIGERGVNLSGGQKQRVQLARALYQDADIYLLDDPFSAVDAHTSTSLFNDYVLGALSKKTVLLVTHHLDFLSVMRSILLMKEGKVLPVASYNELMSSNKEFHDLVTGHKEAAGFEMYHQTVSQEKDINIHNTCANKQLNLVKASGVDQLIKKEERETGDGGLKPYLQYLYQNKGLLYASLAALSHVIFVAGQILQNSWLAYNVQNPQVSTSRLISVYVAIGFSAGIFLFFRSIFIVVLGLRSSKSLFSHLLNSLFHAPMSFFDSTPIGRILSRASYDLNIVDLDVPFSLTYTFCAILNAFSNLGVVAVVTWQVLFIATPIVYVTVRLQRYHLASAKELVRINGTTRSLVTNHLAESISGVKTIRAFEEQDRFLAKMLMLIDKNASPFFQYFAANEWLIQRVEIMGVAILSSSALVMALLPPGTFSSGFVGMALSYGLSLNTTFIVSVHYLCTLANHIISVERLNQYMHLSSEACEIIERNRPPLNWPLLGRIELQNLQIRYREDTPLVLKGISCVFKEGQKIGIVGRTGSGKSTLVGALFRLVEPVGGKIFIDGLDIMTIGLYDLRSRLGIIPQDPVLFRGSVRYNIDPLGQYSDTKIWEILGKCQLREAILAKENGLDSLVVEDGSNWSKGQKQLFCLGRTLLRRSRILVFDEATASIDHATDAILQKITRTEVADCTVITVTHRILTVMDCAMVLSISDGKLVEYDEPEKLIRTEGSLFGELVMEYWSHTAEQDMRWTRSHQIA